MLEQTRQKQTGLPVASAQQQQQEQQQSRPTIPNSVRPPQFSSSQPPRPSVRFQQQLLQPPSSSQYRQIRQPALVGGDISQLAPQQQQILLQQQATLLQASQQRQRLLLQQRYFAGANPQQQPQHLLTLPRSGTFQSPSTVQQQALLRAQQQYLLQQQQYATLQRGGGQTTSRQQTAFVLPNVQTVTPAAAPVALSPSAQQQPGSGTGSTSRSNAVLSNQIYERVRLVEHEQDEWTRQAMGAVEATPGEEMRIRLLPHTHHPPTRGASSMLASTLLQQQQQQQQQDTNFILKAVEIVKRPGQSLGMYIREGNGINRNDGFYVSRMVPGTAVEASGCVAIGDEILAVNYVPISQFHSIDDLVLVISITRRLVLKLKTSRLHAGRELVRPVEHRSPVVFLKTQYNNGNGNSTTSTSNGSSAEQAQHVPRHEQQEESYLDYSRKKLVALPGQRSGTQQQALLVDRGFETLPMPARKPTKRLKTQRRRPVVANGIDAGSVEYVSDSEITNGGSNGNGFHNNEYVPDSRAQRSSYNAPPSSNIENRRLQQQNTGFPPASRQTQQTRTNARATSVQPVPTSNRPTRTPSQQVDGGAVDDEPQMSESTSARARRVVPRSVRFRENGELEEEFYATVDNDTSAIEQFSPNFQQQPRTQSMPPRSPTNFQSTPHQRENFLPPFGRQPFRQVAATHRPAYHSSFPSLQTQESDYNYHRAPSFQPPPPHYTAYGQHTFHPRFPAPRPNQPWPSLSAEAGMGAQPFFAQDATDDENFSADDYLNWQRSEYPAPHQHFINQQQQQLPPFRSSINRFTGPMTPMHPPYAPEDDPTLNHSFMSAPPTLYNNSTQQMRERRLAELVDTAAEIAYAQRRLADQQAWQEFERTYLAPALQRQQTESPSLDQLDTAQPVSVSTSVKQQQSPLPHSRPNSGLRFAPDEVVPPRPPESSTVFYAPETAITNVDLNQTSFPAISGTPLDYHQAPTLRKFVPQPAPSPPHGKRRQQPTVPKKRTAFDERRAAAGVDADEPRRAGESSRRATSVAPAAATTAATSEAEAAAGPVPEDFPPLPQINMNLTKRIQSEKQRVAQGLCGMLRVHLLFTRGLFSSTITIDQFPQLYCVVSLDRLARARTGPALCYGDGVFCWDASYLMLLDGNACCDIMLYRWNQQTKQRKLCFKALINLAPMFATTIIDDENADEQKDDKSATKQQQFRRNTAAVRRSQAALQKAHPNGYRQLGIELEPRGILYCTLHYLTPPTAFVRKAAYSVFGGQIDETVEREVGPNNFSPTAELLPATVRACLDELMARDAQIVPGIHLVAGDEDEILRLQQLIDRATSTIEYVSIVASAVDIATITGLVQHYLRSLPEPVMTDSMQENLRNALLSSNNGDRGSSSEPQQHTYSWTIIVRILDQLPPISRCLLRTIIDHLKLILAYRHSNKLTADQLSSIFGPLLFLSSRTAAVVFPNPYQPCRALLRELLHYWPGQQGESMQLFSEVENTTTTSSSAMSPPRTAKATNTGETGGATTSSSSQGTAPSVIEMPHVQQMREYYESQTRQLQQPPPPPPPPSTVQRKTVQLTSELREKFRQRSQQAQEGTHKPPLRAEPVQAVIDSKKPSSRI